MRISDWSSDVCSSDLIHPSDHSRDDDRDACPGPRHRRARFSGNRLLRHTLVVHYRPPARGDQARARGFRAGISAVNDADFRAGIRRGLQEAIEIVERSEEHTSELPSLMRTSYAVFCLQKQRTVMTA